MLWFEIVLSVATWQFWNLCSPKQPSVCNLTENDNTLINTIAEQPSLSFGQRGERERGFPDEWIPEPGLQVLQIDRKMSPRLRLQVPTLSGGVCGFVKFFFLSNFKLKQKFISIFTCLHMCWMCLEVNSTSFWKWLQA